MALGRNTFVKNILFTKVTLVILLIICAYLASSVYERYMVEREMSDRLDAAYQEQSELTERRDILLEKVDYLQGERGVESEIRRHFDVAREGEQVVIIVDDAREPDATFVEGTDPDVAADHPWWQFWRTE